MSFRSCIWWANTGVVNTFVSSFGQSQRGVALHSPDRYVGQPNLALQVRQLELEARASDPLLSATRVDEIRRVRAVIKNASNRSKALQNDLERNELFGGTSAHADSLTCRAGGGNSFAAGGHYGQLQENDKLLQQGSDYLQTSFAMAQETEMIGAGAAEVLYGQRNMIYNIQGGIGNMRLSLQDADEYLTKLLKQGRLNRVILRVVIGGIIAAIAIIAISRILRCFL